MAEGTRFEDLLYADLAVALGLAAPADVATALQRAWESGAPLSGELGLPASDQSQLEEAVRRTLDSSGGDAQAALRSRGGIDSALHTSLPPETTRRLERDGADVRAPLRSVVPGRYADFTLVGKGGMGVVYLVSDTELHRRVAFKMVAPNPKAAGSTPAPDRPLEATPPSRQEDEDSHRSFEELKVRFLQEAWVTGAMEHPGIVPVYELGETASGIPYYTMRYVEGERTLDTAIRDADDLDARLGLIEPFLKVCDTIRYAHARGIVHRDLKPVNIALGDYGETIVLDWGLSKMEGHPDTTGALWRARIDEFRAAADLQTVAGALGTPGYMAPEAALGQSENVDTLSDVYSLGAILYQILTGALPFEFTSYVEFAQKILHEVPAPPMELDPRIPAELDRVCRRALSKEKEARYPSVAELAAPVRRWQTEGSIDRQARTLFETATDEFKVAQTRTGNILLWHLDRAAASCSKVLHLRPGHAEAQALLGEIKRVRERGIRERVRSDRARLVKFAAVLVLGLASIAALVIAGIVSDAQREAETRVNEARGRATASQVAAAAARSDARELARRLADGYAGLSKAELRRHRVGPARLLAAKALEIAPTQTAWGALAAAEAEWAPAIARVLPDVGARRVAFFPDGSAVAWAAGDGEIRVTEIATGKLALTLRGADKRLTVLRIGAEGKRLVAGTELGQIQVWNLETGALRQTLPEQLAPSKAVGTNAFEVPANTAVTAIDLAPTIASALVGYADGSMRVWDLERGQGLRMPREGDAPVTAVRFAPGRVLMAGDADGRFQIWLVQGMLLLESHATHRGGILHLSNPDEERPPARDGVVKRTDIAVYWASANHIVRNVEIDSGDEFGVFDSKDTPPARHLVYAAASKRLYAVDGAGVLRCFDCENHRLTAELSGFGDRVRALALSENERRLAVAGDDGTLRVYDLVQSSLAPQRPAWLGRRLFVAAADRGIDGYALDGDAEPQRLAGYEPTVTALAGDAKGRRLFAAGVDGTICLWQLGDGTRRGMLSLADAVGTALAVLPGAEQIAVGTLSGEVQVWSWQSRRKYVLPVARDVPVATLVAGPTGGRIYAAHTDGTLVGWDARSRKIVFGPVRLDAACTALALSGNGERIAAASADGWIGIWATESAERLARTVQPAGGVPLGLAFGAEGGLDWRGRDGRHWSWNGRAGEGARSRPGRFATDAAGPAWVLQTSTERLMRIESRFALMLDGLTVQPVPPVEFAAPGSRVEPWSK